MNQAESQSNQHETTDDDLRWMQRAIDLAKLGQGSVEPNPMVGCVLVHDQKLIGEGYHQKFGGPHAEVEALRSCDDAKGSTAYVTLEPCCHQGKTPPCSEALINAGVRRVVIACNDPFPKVDGGGVRQLRDAGIVVDIGLGEQDSESVLAPYLKRVRTGLPWVIAKWAMSVDGKIATASGHSQWITGDEARADVHQVRGRVDAILTGMGTVEADDPMLTARPAGPRVAKRVVVCRKRLPSPDSRLLQTTTTAPTILSVPASLLSAARRLEAKTSCLIIDGESNAGSGDNHPSVIRNTLAELARQGSTNCVVECGGTLMSHFFELSLIDEFHVYIGGIAIGGTRSPGPIGGQGITELTEGRSLYPVEMMQLGRDIRISYR